MNSKNNVDICEGTNEIMNNRLSYIEGKKIVSLSVKLKEILTTILNEIETNYNVLPQMNLKNNEKKNILCKLQTGDYLVRQDSKRYGRSNFIIAVLCIPKRDVIMCEYNNEKAIPNVDKEVVYYSTREMENSLKKVKKAKLIDDLKGDLEQLLNNALNFNKKEKTKLSSSKQKEEPSIDNYEACDLDTPPDRIKTFVNRIIRNTSMSTHVKVLNNYVCQICGKDGIVLSNGKLYAEAHHIKPLGGKNEGPDIESNIICVCPNCHVKLDYGVINLNNLSSSQQKVQKTFIDYHNKNIFNKIL